MIPKLLTPEPADVENAPAGIPNEAAPAHYFQFLRWGLVQGALHRTQSSG